MLEGWRKPRIEHPDPKVRAEAYASMPADDPRYLAAVKSDDDPALRVGLVARLLDPALLHELRADNSNAGLQAAADARLRTLIAGDDTGVDAELLLGGGDAELLEYAARSGHSAALRHAALLRLTAGGTVRAELLESLACSAPDAALRAQAVAGLEDAAALERVAQAVRKSDKHVYRVARDKLAAQRDLEARAARRTALLAELTALAARPLPGQNEALHRRLARLQNWQDAWRDAAGDTDSNGAGDDAAPLAGRALPAEAAEAVAHIQSLIDAARDTVERRRAVLAEAQQALADTAVTTTADQLAALRQRWAEIADHSATEQREFERALADLEQRSSSAERQAALDNRAGTLLTEWESTDWDSAPADERQVRKLGQLWDGLAARGTLSAELHERYRTLRDRLVASVERRAAAGTAAADEANALMTELAAHLEAGRSAEATSLHDKLVHRLRSDKALPGRAVDGIRKRLAALDPKLKELHEWRRWGAQQARDGLCAEAEALAAQAESLKPGKLATRVKALRQKWQTIDKGVGAAPEAQWTRFDTACEVAYGPAKALFEAQAAERKENAAKKRAICERLEEYVRTADWDTPDWDGAVKLLDECRRQWREIGGVTPKQFARLRKRYRLAVAGLDEKLAVERDSERKRRMETIEQLRAGLESEPLEDQIRAAKQAQAQWRPTVRLRRNEEQTLWKQLREVCDQIFARRDARFAGRREAEDAALSARRELCAEVKGLLPGDEPREDAEIGAARATLADARRRWRDAGAVAPKDRAALDRQWRDACKGLEERLARHARRAAGKHDEMLLSRALLAADRIHAVAHDDAAAVAAAETAWQALAEQRGEVARTLTEAWQSAADAAVQKPSSTVRRELCVRLEMLADIDSPAEDQAQRMALKVALLGQALSGEAQDATTRLHALLCDWATAAAAPGDIYPALRERFARAARAISEVS